MFEQCRPEDVSIDSSGIVRFLDDMKNQRLHLHSVMMLRHGKVFLDISYAPWSRDKKHVIWSLTKSFTSTAVGFAVQDGLLDLEDRVIDYFPEFLTNPPCDNMQKMRVKHILTMNTGHEVEPGLIGDNWERRFIQSYVEHEPGTHFLYNTTGTYMLAAILRKVTGKTLLDYLREKLFEPLEMSKDIWAETSPTGIETAGYGFNVRIEDIAKLGQFYLQKGKWNGRQLLNEQWILDAQKPWTDNSQYKGGGGGPDWNAGYGYQFWMCTPEHVFRGDGACGQYCVICPDQDMVIAITGGYGEMAPVLRSVWSNIFPALDRTETGGQELKERLRNPVTAAVWEEKGEKAEAPVLKEEWTGTYQIHPENFLQYDKIEFGENGIHIVDKHNKEVTVSLNRDDWQHAAFLPAGIREETYTDDIAVRAARVGEKLVLHIAYTNTPYEDMLHFSFGRHGLEIDGIRNTGIGDRGYRLIGYRI